MISAEEFLAQITPRSTLAAFHDDIAKLRAAKLSYSKIQQFLQLNGVITHVNNVRGYCQRHIEKNHKSTPVEPIPSLAEKSEQQVATTNTKSTTQEAPRHRKTTKKSAKAKTSSSQSHSTSKNEVKPSTKDKAVTQSRTSKKTKTRKNTPKTVAPKDLQTSLF
ncbi:hypothetical protein [Pelistega europaea]|uniref:Uncharacterized protein n=1 Tax=Pelistega europaea TaxID=106147 RepID=A0A7Y4L9G2_9BURK|nr:hypothetical protein [Pelistega europaea]NOL49435.1 hypothetical protein [Pelistega europaea]